MAITLTVQDVRDIVPELSATDAAVTLQISVVGCKVDACLEANYADCPDLAKAIKIYTVAYFADKGNDNKGSVTMTKWADGDSQQYADKGANSSSSYWDTVLQLDSAGCVQNAFRSGKVFAVTGSTSKSYSEAV
jgi:hypothetical protein